MKAKGSVNDNVIRINKAEFDRLCEVTSNEDYLKESFEIATKDKFPLHNIHYIFDKIYPGEVYEVDVNISATEETHIIECRVKYNGRRVGNVTVTMNDYDSKKFDWKMNYRTMAFQKDKEWWLREVGAMTTTISMAVAYTILHAKRVLRVATGEKRVGDSQIKTSDESLYNKLKVYISEASETVHTGNGPKPQHEFDVRGHVRHLKNGKEVYVRPYTKCKGRGTKIKHEYVLVDNK